MNITPFCDLIYLMAAILDFGLPQQNIFGHPPWVYSKYFEASEKHNVNKLLNSVKTFDFQGSFWVFSPKYN